MKTNLQDKKKETECLRYAFCQKEEAILLGSLIEIPSKESCDHSAGGSLQPAHRLFIFDLNVCSFFPFLLQHITEWESVN